MSDHTMDKDKFHEQFGAIAGDLTAKFPTDPNSLINPVPLPRPNALERVLEWLYSDLAACQLLELSPNDATLFGTTEIDSNTIRARIADLEASRADPVWTHSALVDINQHLLEERNAENKARNHMQKALHQIVTLIEGIVADPELKPTGDIKVDCLRIAEEALGISSHG